MVIILTTQVDGHLFIHLHLYIIIKKIVPRVNHSRKGDDDWFSR